MSRESGQYKMSRSNTIGIVGRIIDTPELIVDAANWERKVYETKLKRVRPSGTEDIFILQFDGCAAGSEEMVKKIYELTGLKYTFKGENVTGSKKGKWWIE